MNLDGLGDAGWEALVAHGVRTSVDLRSSWERTDLRRPLLRTGGLSSDEVASLRARLVDTTT